MPQHLQREIEKLKKAILALGTIVEESLRKSVKALSNNNPTLAELVISTDDLIDQMEVDLEEDCLKILALHQPVAIDLRFIISVLKINNDLERIGDLAANIAERVLFLADNPLPEIPVAIPQMAQMVQYMLQKSLDALVEMDAELALQVCKADDEVDDLHSKIYPYIGERIKEDPQHIATWIQLLGVARYLERAADHTTNIAEDVIYLVEGKIKRHR